MQPSKRNISKKHIEKEIYKTFEIFKKQKNISIADFLNRYGSVLFCDHKYRKIKFSYESLFKLVLYQKLKGIKFQTKLVRFLKRNPKEKYRLGFSQTPNQTTISFFVKLRFGYHSFPLTAFAQMGGMFASLRSAQPSALRPSRTQNHQDMTALT